MLLIFDANYYIYASMCVLVSYNIQLLRGEEKSTCNTTIKRTARIIGFLFVPLINPLIFKTIAVYTIISLLIFNKKKIDLEDVDYRICNLDMIMIFHQVHYFSYCYFIMYLLFKFYPAYKSFAGIIIFVLGWISYTSVKHLIFIKDLFRVVVCAHILLSVTLLMINFIYPWSFTFILLWIVTGFFGGSVYIIKNILKNNQETTLHIDFVEDLGHLLGAALSLSVVFSGIQSYMFVFSATSALITALLIIRYRNICVTSNTYEKSKKEI